MNQKRLFFDHVITIPSLFTHSTWDEKVKTASIHYYKSNIISELHNTYIRERERD